MISVLTVNYHSRDDVAGLVETLRLHRCAQPVELVVANHSPDDPIESDEASDMPVHVLPRPNDGFAAGINAAFAASHGDLLFITNPDLRLSSGALDAAARFLDENPTIGILLPMLRYPDGRVQPSVRRFYTWRVALFARSPTRSLGHQPRFFREYLYEGIDQTRPTDVDWGIGAAMFLRRADFAGPAIFDPRFFLYFEDVDLCCRTWQAGRRVVYDPRIVCVHAHRRSSAVPVGRHAWHHFVSLLRFIRKHGGLPQRPQTHSQSIASHAAAPGASPEF